MLISFDSIVSVAAGQAGEAVAASGPWCQRAGGRRLWLSQRELAGCVALGLLLSVLGGPSAGRSVPFQPAHQRTGTVEKYLMPRVSQNLMRGFQTIHLLPRENV